MIATDIKVVKPTGMLIFECIIQTIMIIDNI